MEQLGPEHLAELLRRHGPALVLYARTWCETPDDVVQEALLSLIAQRHLPHNVAAWLFRTVRNAAISASRASTRRRRYESRAARDQATWFDVSPGDLLDAHTATEALESLTPDHREAIVARLWGGLTFEEIAALMSCSASAAHRRYASGLAHLRERLGVACQSDNETTNP